MLYTERQQPFLTYLQVSEGLKQLVTSETQRDALLDYDRKKLDEFSVYHKESESHPT